MAKRPRILLVDDSAETLEGLKSYFVPRYDVCTAFNGLEGLKVFEEDQEQPDLVITDLVMPNISGVGLISLLKKQSPNTPIIAITGWGNDPSEMAKRAKADKILMKPFDLEDLGQSVSKLLAEKR
jgi:CheY-like chemotaxis protein